MISEEPERIAAEEMAGALGNISTQQHPWEMEVSDGCDFEYAYNKMIKVARKALQKWKEVQDD